MYEYVAIREGEKENMCVGESVEVDERKVWVQGLNFNPKPKHLLSRFILGVSIEKVGLKYSIFTCKFVQREDNLKVLCTHVIKSV